VTRHPHEHAVSEEGSSARVVKLVPVVTLDVLYGRAELRGHV
jgi:hypothetical protein